MDAMTIGFAIFIGLIVQLLILHSLIRDATYAKETRKKLDAMTNLLSEIARKHGVDVKIVDNILEDSRSK